jgi:hypothetical protein
MSTIGGFSPDVVLLVIAKDPFRPLFGGEETLFAAGTRSVWKSRFVTLSSFASLKDLHIPKITKLRLIRRVGSVVGEKHRQAGEALPDDAEQLDRAGHCLTRPSRHASFQSGVLPQPKPDARLFARSFSTPEGESIIGSQFLR